MDDTTPKLKEVPLPLFLELLWGYKKGVELRDRAVPGPEVITLLESVPEYEKYFYIQRNPEGLDTVWQKDEWRTSGQKQEDLRLRTESMWNNIDIVIGFLQPAFGILGKDALRALASDMVNNKKWLELKGMGVDLTKLKGI